MWMFLGMTFHLTLTLFLKIGRYLICILKTAYRISIFFFKNDFLLIKSNIWNKTIFGELDDLQNRNHFREMLSKFLTSR